MFVIEQIDFIGGAGKKLSSGYGGTPGLGPDGETCGSCEHCRYSAGHQKRYYKCGIGHITSGAATDIRLKTPACQYWLQSAP